MKERFPFLKQLPYRLVAACLYGRVSTGGGGGGGGAPGV